MTVDIPRFYAPVSNLLLGAADKSKWKGMRTVGQIKRESGVRTEVTNQDNLYTEVHRQTKVFKDLQIPRSLQVGSRNQSSSIRSGYFKDFY